MTIECRAETIEHHPRHGATQKSVMSGVQFNVILIMPTVPKVLN